MIAAAFAVPLAIVALPFIPFLNGMAAQPKAKGQGTYGRAFGQSWIVDRMPVPGAQPQGVIPERHRPPYKDINEAVRAGQDVSNPEPVTMPNLRRGRELYDTFCIVCHGPRGDGDGAATGPNRMPAPPSLHTDQARGYPDGAIFEVMTYGVGKMPSYMDKLTPDDRWRVVHYVRALQLAAQSPARTIGDIQEAPGTQPEGHPQ